MRRDFAVVVAIVAGAVAGFYLGGGRGGPDEYLDPNQPVGAYIVAIVLAAVAGWIVNRWIEHKPKAEQ